MVIETNNLVKKYGEKTAVNGISISIPEGQIYGFLGANGAGKSTFIKMLLGLVFPTSGNGLILGKPLGDVSAREKIGYLPELFRYQEWMTGEDLLNFHTSLFHLKKSKDRNIQVLKRVGLLGQEKYKVGSYSKGMQQRLGLACALLPNPKILFLDEPTSALDPIGRKSIRDIIVELKKEGATVFLNSHLLSEVEAVSDSITIINKGKVVKSGLIKDVLMEKVKLTIRYENINEEIISTLKNNFDENLKQTDNIIFITLEDKEQIPTIASYLISKQVKIYELTPHQETLENVFLRAVGEEEK